MGNPSQDIASRSDIFTLVESFYRRAFQDELIGPVFTDVAKLDHDHHLPILTDFGETVLFRTGSYNRNALKLHLLLNEKHPLTRTHFNRWLTIWQNNVDNHFAGDRADFAKLQAERIAWALGNRMAEATARAQSPSETSPGSMS